MNNEFIKDLLLIYIICNYQKYDSLGLVISQLRYSTIEWLVSHKTINNPNTVQKKLTKLLVDEYNKEPIVPEAVLKYPAPPKPQQINKVVDISVQNPYNFSITAQKLDLEVNVINRLGQPGKEGTVYLVNMFITNDPVLQAFSQACGNTYAMKVYRKKKSYTNVMKEARFQQMAAHCGVAPKVYAIMEKSVNLDVDGPAFIMDLAGERVVDRIKRQNGLLTPQQQFNLLTSALKLDSCGISQNDPNPLNFMFESKTSDNIIWIDFGFAKKQKSNEINNFLSLKAFLHSGMMGVVSRKLLKPEGARILEFWIGKANNQDRKLSEEDIKLIKLHRLE